METKPKSSNVPNVLTLLTCKKILKFILSVIQITAPIAVKCVVKLSVEARVSTEFFKNYTSWSLDCVFCIENVDTVDKVVNWMSIKIFIPVRNRTSATSADMQRQLAVICPNTKKKNIRIFKNLTFSNNCIFSNFTLFNKKDISLLSKKTKILKIFSVIWICHIAFWYIAYRCTVLTVYIFTFHCSQSPTSTAGHCHIRKYF